MLYFPLGIFVGIILYLWDKNDGDIFLFSDLNNQTLVRNSIPKWIININKFYFENLALIVVAVSFLVVFILFKLNLKQIERRIKIGWANYLMLNISFFCLGIWGFLEFFDNGHKFEFIRHFSNDSILNLYLYSPHKVNNLFAIGLVLSFGLWVLYINIKYTNKVLSWLMSKLKSLKQWLKRYKIINPKENKELLLPEENYDLLGLPLSFDEFDTKLIPFIRDNYSSEEIPAILNYFKDLNKSKDKSMLLLEKIILLKAEKSYSFGITGDWGMGKTTFLNLIKHDLENHSKIDIKEKIVWLDFNPWNFSNSSELITDFFNLLNSQLNKLYGFDFSSLFKKYSELVTPLTDKNDFIKTLVKLSKNIFKKPESLRDISQEIREKMNDIDVKFIITLDDLDRMAPEEIIMIVFKLVKSLANFPNIIFILSYDPTIIKKAISYEIKEVDAGNYLQKIINFSIPISGPSHEQNKYSFEEIKVILAYYITHYFKLQNINESTKEIFHKLTEVLLFKYWKRYCIRSNHSTDKMPSSGFNKMLQKISNHEYYKLEYSYKDTLISGEKKLYKTINSINTFTNIKNNFINHHMENIDFNDIENAKIQLKRDLRVYEFQDGEQKRRLTNSNIESVSKLLSVEIDNEFSKLIAEFNFTPRSIVKIVINFKLNLENQEIQHFRDILENDKMDDEIYKIWDQSIDEFLDW